MEKRTSEAVELDRSTSLTGYPLAQLCEWVPAPNRQIAFEPSEGESAAKKYWWEHP